MKKNHPGKAPRRIALLVGATLLTLASQSVWAVGTASGTTISNTATGYCRYSTC